MKGIIIFEDSNPTLKNIYCINLTNSDIRMDLCSEETYTLTGIRNNMKGATCNKDDSYDFETGALIALMKMCGVEKVKQAVNETFFDVTRTVVNEYEEDIKKLKEENNYLNYIKSCRESAIESLENTRDLLINKNNELIEEKEKLQHDYDLCKNSENALKCSVHYLNKSIAKLNVAIYGYKEDLNKVAERCKEVEEENEKLKLDCEKLQHGYNDMIFCGGRQNGKQYTFLKKLFRSIPKDKVEAAYEEAYNTKLPLWQKEVLKQMYDMHKESKEKIELQGFHIEAKPPHNDQLDSLIEQSRAFTRKCVDEWLYEPQTKRTEMWNDILACDCEHYKYIEVKKEDIGTFVKECNEKKIFNTIGYELKSQERWFGDDSCIFQIFRKPAGFICAHRVSFAPEDNIVDYHPPMRWDLFEKGRKIVRVTPENIDDFILKCTNKFGSIMKPVLKRYKDFTHAFIMISDYHYDNKPTIHIMTPEDLVRNQHENPKKYSDKKIVDWEDVR